MHRDIDVATGIGTDGEIGCSRHGHGHLQMHLHAHVQVHVHVHEQGQVLA